jgi:hypothetical protein
MILVYTRATDGAVTKPDGTPGRYSTADMIEAEALYMGLCAIRTDDLTEAIIKYPDGTEIPDGRFRRASDWTGLRESNSQRRNWTFAAPEPSGGQDRSPPCYLVRAACRYAKTTKGLMAYNVAGLIGINDRTIRNYMADPENTSHRKMPPGLWWLLLVRLGLHPADELETVLGGYSDGLDGHET